MFLINFNTELLIPGESYTRKELALMWGYQKEHSLRRGIVTPKGHKLIFLFITQIKQSDQTQYKDRFDNDILHMEGEEKNGNDNRLINAHSVQDQIFLFYRTKHHKPFVYYGEVHLIDYFEETNKTTKFRFQTYKDETNAMGILRTIEDTKRIEKMNFEIREEGKRYTIIINIPKREIKNRMDAIKLHGITCFVCGFNFDAFYGKELSKQFIEIHHLKPLSDHTGLVNPELDLVPVCSNCHSMLHRDRNNSLSVEELKRHIQKNNNKLT